MTDEGWPAGDPHEAYPAPPAWRPMSALAVLSLVLAILLGLVAILGLWWAEVLPLLLGIAALGVTGPAKKRGRGLAIAGIALSAAGGAFSFLTHRALETAIEKHIDGLVAALDRGDRTQAEGFRAPAPAPSDADGGEAARPGVDAWIARAAVAKERLGAYRDAVTVGSVFLGFMVALVPPEGVDEVEPRGGTALGLGEAVWARAAYEKGMAWFAFVGGEKGRPGSALEELKEGVGEESRARKWVRDVRVYLDRAAKPER